MTKNLLAAFAFTSFALLTGCANNAIFELQVILPAVMQPIPTAPQITHVKMQIQPGPSVWGDSWAVTSTQTVGPIALTGVDQEITIDVEGDGDHLDGAVDVRILYCSSDDCGNSVSERWFEFRRPFFKGKVTNYRIEAALTTTGLEVSDDEGTEPPPAQVIDKCQVAGCVDTNGEFLANYCDNGVHWCERE